MEIETIEIHIFSIDIKFFLYKAGNLENLKILVVESNIHGKVVSFQKFYRQIKLESLEDTTDE